MTYYVNENLKFCGEPTSELTNYLITVNDKILCYVDLEDIGFNFESNLIDTFKNICELICYELFHNDENFEVMNKCFEGGLREIKENY